MDELELSFDHLNYEFSSEEENDDEDEKIEDSKSDDGNSSVSEDDKSEIRMKIRRVEEELSEQKEELSAEKIEEKSVKEDPDLEQDFSEPKSDQSDDFRLHLSSDVEDEVGQNVAKKSEIVKPQRAKKVKQIFRCHKCDFVTRKSQSLKYHLEIQSVSVKKCSICEYRNCSVKTLKNHFLRNHGQKCKYCPFMSTSKYNFKKHQKDFHTIKKGKKKKKCDLCDEEFSQEEAKRHFENQHGFFRNEDKKFQCSACQLSFKEMEKLTTHFKIIHLGRKDYVCHICNFDFGWKESLKRHLDICSEDKLIHKCSRCDAITSSKALISKHENEVHGIICGKCNAKFHSKKDFQEHAKKVHDFGQKSFHNIIAKKCQSCHFQGMETDLIKHFQKAHGPKKNVENEDERFSCENCQKTFKLRIALKTHLKKCSENDEDLNCIACNFKGNSRKDLDNHYNKEHLKIGDLFSDEDQSSSGEKSFETFDLDSSHSENLDSHQEYDNSEKGLFSCKKCDFSDDDYGSFNYHVKLCDKAEKYVFCQSCGFKSLPKVVADHRKNIHGKKCSKCDFKSCSGKAMKVHEKTHAKAKSIEDSSIARFFEPEYDQRIRNCYYECGFKGNESIMIDHYMSSHDQDALDREEENDFDLGEENDFDQEEGNDFDHDEESLLEQEEESFLEHEENVLDENGDIFFDEEKDDKFLCHKCDTFSTSTIELLESHIRTCSDPVHEEIASFFCHVCNYQLQTVQTLTDHFKQKHPGVKKRFKCRGCDYKTDRHSDAKKHEEIFCKMLRGEREEQAKLKRKKIEVRDCSVKLRRIELSKMTFKVK